MARSLPNRWKETLKLKPLLTTHPQEVKYMNLKLVVSVPRSRSKRAVDHFKSCPSCGAKNLIPVIPDVICPNCAWNSYWWQMEDGDADDLRATSEFQASLRRSKLKVVHSNPEPPVLFANTLSKRRCPDADAENVS